MTHIANQIYDIVSVDSSGQRQADPVARVLAPSRKSALQLYAANPSAYQCAKSGEVVQGLTLTAYQGHPRLFKGPFVLSGRKGVLGIYYSADAAQQAMEGHPLEADESLTLVANDYCEQARVVRHFVPHPWVVAIRSAAAPLSK